MEENQQQTQPTYDAGSGNRTRDTLVGGERSGVTLGALALTAVNRYVCIVEPKLYPVCFTKKKTLYSIIIFTLGWMATLRAPISFEWPLENFFCTVTRSKLSAIEESFTVLVRNYHSSSIVYNESCVVMEAFIERLDYCELQTAKEQLTHMKFEHLEIFWLPL